MPLLSKAEPEIVKKHMENFLVDHWSVSSILEFIRNEKSFERKYIFGDRDKQMSLPQIIGNVYHATLMHFFKKLQIHGEKMSFDELAFCAHSELGMVGADEYRPQKEKTIEQLQNEALKCVNVAIKSFLSEYDAYSQEIQEILFVEESFRVFVSINGIEIPLPLKIKPDLVFVNKDGELCVLDHKSKKSYSDEKDITLRYGNQTITYSLGMSVAIQQYPDLIKRFPKIAEGVKKFFFYENKYISNRNGARQIKQIPINIAESGPLLEQILFEGVFRMVEAVQNPDYVYLMNPHDHFQDSAEMVAFWIKTHIEGLEGFPNLPANTKRLLAKKRSQIRRSAITGIPKSIVKSFSNPVDFISFSLQDMENLSIQERIEHRLRTFNYLVKVEHKISGYSCDTYLLKISAGVKTNSIYGYRMDIANAIGVKDVRISNQLVEYENDVYVAIEVNRKDHRSLTLPGANQWPKNEFPIGEDNFGKVWTWNIDNPSTPHMMIAGSSGSGKSVAIKTLISVATAQGIKVTILDPKHEFLEYRGSIDVLNELEEIELFMAYKVEEMDKIFKGFGAKGNSSNKQLIIFDESADCFTRASKEKGMATLEQNTLILSQKARSAGIHLVLAAQRFSVKILTGDAKANFSTRLCLTVASGIDSKVMLGVEGAEKLNGKGDALFTAPGIGEPVRIQCFSTL